MNRPEAVSGASGMWNILYVSSATYDMPRADLERLLDDSRAWNKEHDVTGVLLHCRGNFMQLLEGPRQGVDLTFARVLASRAHHNVIEMLNQAGTERIFGEWAMADASVNPERFEEMVRAKHGHLLPRILRTFWDTNR